MRWLFACGFLVFGVVTVSACSKENNVAQNTNVAGGDQCAGAGDQGCGVGSVCVLGKCRHGCTNDVECPQGSICVGDRPPYGCTTAEEGACSASAPCPTGLKCGLDGMCRHPCETSTNCPRNEHVCAAGTCLGKSEKDADRWTCDDVAPVDREDRYTPWNYFREGVTNSCNVYSPGWSQPDRCGDDERAFADVFTALPPTKPGESTVVPGTWAFACPTRTTCPSGRYFCNEADESECAADPSCAGCSLNKPWNPPGSCLPSKNPLPTICHCIENDVLPCGLSTEKNDKLLIPVQPVDCALQLPKMLEYTGNGAKFYVNREKPLLVSSERVLVEGADYTIDATTKKIVLLGAACKLPNITTYTCRLDACPEADCTDSRIMW